MTVNQKLVLFVCISNTCRSPIAEHLFRRKLAEKFKNGEFEVASRSLSTDYEPEGSPASEQGIQVREDSIFVSLCLLLM